MTTSKGLRERKKHATRAALRTAALRLALNHGFGNLRVDDIAAAADVSPRTFNNYYSSREHAVVAAVLADRDARIAEAVLARPANIAPSVAVGDAIVSEYAGGHDSDRDAMLMITTNPTLAAAYVRDSATESGRLREAIARRCPEADQRAVRVLVAAIGAAVRVALEDWLSPTPGGLVVPGGDLSALLREVLAPLAPAIDALGGS
ncbi:TetR family transcriptional regulator [Stackebrandtia endophytica]|uniref:TetR family transcriptional regulator n=1 Tax=Stackebrandtia endophytica TaxID=1496996 RepID=A0A543B3T9_9ACTN|nr:TetR/AcrR family transcriptional regulator [Stackebrandtia endophytica]TQL79463.1 TetR family transcriptional regulator [Stackebrandtia endophytica]